LACAAFVRDAARRCGSAMRLGDAARPYWAARMYKRFDFEGDIHDHEA
jgi:hypothetical protein